VKTDANCWILRFEYQHLLSGALLPKGGLVLFSMGVSYFVFHRFLRDSRGSASQCYWKLPSRKWNYYYYLLDRIINKKHSISTTIIDTRKSDCQQHDNGRNGSKSQETSDYLASFFAQTKVSPSAHGRTIVNMSGEKISVGRDLYCRK
jgi:hypothetical protein